MNPLIDLDLKPGTSVDLGAILTLAAAAANVNGSDNLNTTRRGIKVAVNITAITGTSPTLTVSIQGKDPASGNYYTILSSAALTATGMTVLTVYPGLAAAANAVADDVLPPTWRVIAAIGGTAPSVTATVGASLLN